MKDKYIILLTIIGISIFIPYGFNIESKFHEIDCNKIINDNPNITVICDDFSGSISIIFWLIIISIITLTLICLNIYIKYKNKNKIILE